MKIIGIEGLSFQQVQDAVANGGRFVIYRYGVSGPGDPARSAAGGVPARPQRPLLKLVAVACVATVCAGAYSA